MKVLYEIDSKESIYLVNSKTERDVKYLVNMELGICNCIMLVRVGHLARIRQLLLNIIM